MCMSICACGSSNEKSEEVSAVVESEVVESEVVEEEPEYVMNNEYITVNAVAVNDSYRDEDESPLRTVYLFYTINAKDSNLEIDSKYTTMTVADNNSYDSEFIPGLCDYATSYYYSSYIEDVYTGESLDVVATFKIPTGDLEAGKKITISDDQIPEVDSIYFRTDDIQHFDSDEAIAQAIDPAGYNEAMKNREEADAQRSSEVKNLVNGYQWSFYVNNTSYTIEFWADNNFELRTAFGTNGGTYSVRNGYIFCTYDSNGAVVEIPYVIENGDISLDVTTAFDVKSK